MPCRLRSQSAQRSHRHRRYYGKICASRTFCKSFASTKSTSSEKKILEGRSLLRRRWPRRRTNKDFALQFVSNRVWKFRYPGFQTYCTSLIATRANASPAIARIKTSSPQINRVACRSCFGVGCVMPKKLMNPWVMKRRTPIPCVPFERTRDAPLAHSSRSFIG